MATSQPGNRAWISRHPTARSVYPGLPVLVLGADGFLGRNCTEALLDLGADVTVLIHKRQGSYACTGTNRVQGDLQDETLLPALLAGKAVIFDCIGASGAAYSNRYPEQNLLGECLPQLRLLEACKQQRLQPTIVFCSSRLVYGQPRYLPVDEQHPLQPLSMYAVHKLAVENYLKIYHRQVGLHYCIFRLSNPYGPYQPVHTQSYGIINLFVYRAASGKPIRVYGEGLQKRDYIHVDDVIGVFLLAAIDPACRDRVFNLGGREAISLRDAAATLTALSGAPAIEHVSWPEEDEGIESGDYLSSLHRLDDALELPDFINFNEGIGQTLKYYRVMLARACRAQG